MRSCVHNYCEAALVTCHVVPFIARESWPVWLCANAALSDGKAVALHLNPGF